MTLSSSKTATTFKNTKTPGKFELVVFGDVHLGHHRTPSCDIINALYAITANDAKNKLTDMIVIEGDLFDRLLFLNNEYYSHINSWMVTLLGICKKYDIVLRVLEGTPSHDMRQPANFISANDAYGIGADLKYVDDLSIEVIDKFGISILYLPDEWNTSLEMCYIEAQKKLAEYKLDKADIIVMHGAFDYQLPDIAGIETHNSTLWQELVKWHIFVGHVHQYSQYGKIVATGSLDRLCHGDEGAKGYLRATLFEGGSELKFIENTKAKLFQTLRCDGLSVEEIFLLVQNFLPKPKGSYIRLQGNKDQSLISIRDQLKIEHPEYFWDIKITKEVTEESVSSLVPEKYMPIAITRQNISSLLMERLIQKGIDNTIAGRAVQLLTERCGV